MKLSISTKLVAGTTLLLLAVIAFLNFTTAYLFQEDKRAYVYQSQSASVGLVGREIAGSLKRGIDTARRALGAFDPSKPVGPETTAALQTLVANQDAVTSVRVLLLDAPTGKTTPVAAAPTTADSSAQGDLAPEWWKVVEADLFKNGYAFVNLTNVGGEPSIGVLVADLKSRANPTGVPVALTRLPLEALVHDLRGLSFTIASTAGWVLYDTSPTRMYGRQNISDDPLFDRAVRSKASLGAAEYEQSGEKMLGSYANPGLDLVVLGRTEWKKAVQSVYTLTEKCVLLGGFALGMSAILAVFFSKSLTAPIQKLYRATFDIAQGKFDLNLEPSSRDEIGGLTESFNHMSRQIGDLVVERMHKVQIENELAIASTVQRTLIPPETFADDKIMIQSHYRSASTCGGDWWGFFRVGSRACIMIADATGHGFPSALITATARSCFSILQKLAQDHGGLTFSPLAMLNYANRAVYDASGASIMMTMFVAMVDFEASTMTFANAGHNPPWLFRRDGDKFSLSSLVASGYRLGERAECAEFEQNTVPFAPGDMLFLYTDGLFEGKGPTGEMFGKKRAKRVVESQLTSGPKAVVDGVMEAFLAHNGDKELDDDVTIAVAMLLPTTAPPRGSA